MKKNVRVIYMSVRLNPANYVRTIPDRIVDMI